MEEDADAMREDDAFVAPDETSLVTYEEISADRLKLQAEEHLYTTRQQALDVTGLETYLRASAAASAMEQTVDRAKEAAEASASRVESLQSERSRKFLSGLKVIDGGLRSTFRALVKHGDCCLEYASQTPSILFSEGISITVKPPRAEWSRFEQLSGGQQAMVAVACASSAKCTRILLP